ncbi:MAG: hypothetical protein ACRDVD_07550 [Acidimicrobiia bacterium]
MRRLTTVALAVVFLGACGGDGVVSGETEPDAVPTTAAEHHHPSTSVPSSSTIPLTSADRAVVDAALADLAEREGVTPAEIAVMEFERLVWSDGSLGCPEPGAMYTQALVDGSRVTLRLGGFDYSYHAGADDVPFLCDRPVLTDPGDGAER